MPKKLTLKELEGLAKAEGEQAVMPLAEQERAMKAFIASLVLTNVPKDWESRSRKEGDALEEAADHA